MISPAKASKSMSRQRSVAKPLTVVASAIGKLDAFDADDCSLGIFVDQKSAADVIPARSAS